MAPERTKRYRVPKPTDSIQTIRGPTIDPSFRYISQNAAQLNKLNDVEDDLVNDRSQYPSLRASTNLFQRKFNTSSSQKYGEEKSNLLKGVGFLKDVVAVHFDETPPNEVNRNAHAQFRFKARKYKTDSQRIVYYPQKDGNHKSAPRFWKRMIPFEQCYCALMWAHGNEHNGRDKMFGKLGKNYCTANLSKDLINKWLKLCPCAENKTLKGKVSEPVHNQDLPQGQLDQHAAGPQDLPQLLDTNNGFSNPTFDQAFDHCQPQGSQEPGSDATPYDQWLGPLASSEDWLPDEAQFLGTLNWQTSKQDMWLDR